VLYRVVTYYLRANLTCKAILIRIKRVVGAHSRNNIAEAILQVIYKYVITEKIDYLQANNTRNNDTYTQAIFKAILLNVDLAYYQLHCYSHIINLAAKAFLFSNKPDAFKLKIDNLKKLKLETRHELKLLTL
jgi:hypothetical protein